MITRFARPVVATALLGAAAAIGVAVLAPHPAQAATKPTHVGIVVRLSNSSTVTKCVKAGGDGLDVLVRGFPNTQIGSSGPYAGFVLKINGTGQNPPDDTHYWSYWHRTSSAWKYSSTGAGSYTPKAGAVEGWSYVAGQQSPPKPPAKSYAQVCAGKDAKPSAPSMSSSAPATSSSAPAHTSSAPAAPNPSRSRHSSPARSSSAASSSAASSSAASPSASASSTPPAAVSSTLPAPHHRSGHHAPSGHRSHSGHPAAPSSGTGTFAPPTGAKTADRTARAGQSTVARPSASPVAAQSDGSSGSGFPATGTVLALVVLAALGVTAWLRLRRRAD